MNFTSSNVNLTELNPEVSQNFPNVPSGKNALSDSQKAVIDLLILGKSYSAAARMVGIDRRTIFNWRQDEEFAGELDRRRNELWNESADRIRGMVQSSLDVLEEHLTDCYDRNRFRAATAILRLSDIRKSVPV